MEWIDSLLCPTAWNSDRKDNHDVPQDTLLDGISMTSPQRMGRLPSPKISGIGSVMYMTYHVLYSRCGNPLPV
jgi:hypothetical protein